jgi:hypothetical protein
VESLLPGNLVEKVRIWWGEWTDFPGLYLWPSQTWVSFHAHMTQINGLTIHTESFKSRLQDTENWNRCEVQRLKAFITVNNRLADFTQLQESEPKMTVTISYTTKN